MLKNLKPLVLFSMIGIPFNLSKWVPFQVNIQGEPSVSVVGDTLKIKTMEEAGGFAYFLDEPVAVKDSIDLKWDWRIKTHPSVSSHYPVNKKNDDYALRVGVLVSDGRQKITLPRQFKHELRKRRLRLSYVVFFSASTSKTSSCVKNPYQEHAANCLVHARVGKKQSVTVSIQKALKEAFHPNDALPGNIRVIGFWLFADSDNSKSKSEAEVSNLRFSYR